MYIEDENEHSSASWRKLKEECAKLSSNLSLVVIESSYPNLAIVAKEFKASAEMRDLAQACLFFGRNRKIEFIKHIREIHPLSLVEAKYIADGYFARHGW